jgi:hypothetical protein
LSQIDCRLEFRDAADQFFVDRVQSSESSLHKLKASNSELALRD